MFKPFESKAFRSSQSLKDNNTRCQVLLYWPTNCNEINVKIWEEDKEDVNERRSVCMWNAFILWSGIIQFYEQSYFFLLLLSSDYSLCKENFFTYSTNFSGINTDNKILKCIKFSEVLFFFKSTHFIEYIFWLLYTVLTKLLYIVGLH